MRRILTVLAVIIFTALIPAQDKSMHRGDERKPVKVRAVDALELKLKQLDEQYISKLRRNDQRRAADLLEEMYDLINKIRAEMKPPVFEPIVMSNDDFRDLMHAVKKEAFETNQLNILEVAAAYGYFSVEQLINLTEQFAFSSGKLGAVKLVYPKVADKYNSYKLIDAFTFLSDKEEVRRIIKASEYR